ncbi:hypothetical protein AVEN_59867-1 [Araneus ventricosus]|uniref:Uncharacterized protein n=1 Tax=Araneus ventricosus TaxID=182803 RepID=A0A4Y2FHT9_ARAVE|nr:hypothetical protein AVEN_59867-1 [Araneus ventricosus]
MSQRSDLLKRRRNRAAARRQITACQRNQKYLSNPIVSYKTQESSKSRIRFAGKYPNGMMEGNRKERRERDGTSEGGKTKENARQRRYGSKAPNIGAQVCSQIGEKRKPVGQSRASL